MMKRLVLTLMSLSWSSLLLANNIVSNDDILKIVASPSHVPPSSSRDFISSKIKICSDFNGSNKECKEYPEVSSLIFPGTVSDWGTFFNRCNNFDYINNMTDITVAVTTLVAMPNMGFLKTIGAEIGVNYIGSPAYPSNVNKEALQKSAEMVLYILKNKNKQIRIHSRYLIALQEILGVCSTLLEDEYKNRLATKCIRGCHEARIGETSPVSAPLVNNVHPQTIPREFEPDVDALRDYLRTVSQ